jgi:hypothetical protein
MKRTMCGIVLLTAATALWSCNGDPTGSIRDETPPKILADPTSVFVQQGGTKFVTVELVDGQGNQLAAEFAPQNVGSGITVEKDTTYLETSTGQPIQTSSRFIVGGVGAVSTSFDLVSEGATVTIPGRVVPAGAGVATAVVSSTGPTAADPTVLTVAAPFQFFPDSGVSFNTGPGIIIDRSADGHSITVLPPPGTVGPGTATVLVDYLPTVPIPTTTDVPLTISATVPAKAGTDAPATAPEITIPAPGGTGGFFDAGSFGASTCGDESGIPCQLYKFTLAEDGSFDATLTWSNTTDLGLYILSGDGTTDTGIFCDAAGNGGDGQPEACTVSLPAGTYIAAVVSFAPFYPAPDNVNPTWVRLDLTTPAP